MGYHLYRCTFSPQIEECAEEAARSLLVKQGLKLNKASAPDKFLDNSTVTLSSDENGNESYVIIKDKIKKSWEQVRELSIDVKYTQKIEKDLLHSLSYTEYGIEEDAWEQLETLYNNSESSCIRRAIYYISAYNSEFEMNRISRDGGGKLVGMEGSSC